MMNLVLDKSITETPEFTGQFMLSPVLSGEHVGIREERDGRWLVSFCGLDLGFAGPQRKTFIPLSASPPPEASPM